ncbi:MAG: hypothetical protein D6784_12390 [Chloroflexi bacterium]|nr:MAG: hypothetical protein D6784_12390 [Chloroflexota bacterium]
MGVAALVTLDEQNRCRQARLVYVNGGDHPYNAASATALLAGQPLSAELIEAAADAAATRDLDPPSDIHATAEFRRHLARVLTRRALTRAAERAAGQGG